MKYPNTSRNYLILDKQGHLLKLDMDKRFTDKILSFHSGSINGMDTSPICHISASLGIDGNLCVYDYISKQLLNRVCYSTGGTTLVFFPGVRLLSFTNCLIYNSFNRFWIKQVVLWLPDLKMVF